MAEIASVSAIGLALLMVYAGQAKLRAHSLTTRSFRELGLPLPSLAAWLVPAAELAIAVALLIVPGWGGVAAFVLLIGFTTFLVSIVRSGKAVSCGCFGSTSSDPVSVSEIGRNVILLLLAALATSTTSLVRPDFASVVVVSIGGLTALTLVQLVSLRSQIGSLFRINLAGELQDTLG